MIIRNFFYLLSSKEKKSLLINATISVIVSVIESASVLGIVLFISYASNIDEIHEENLYIAISKQVSISPVEFVNIFAVALCIFYLFKTIAISYFTHRMINFSESTYRTIFNKLLQAYINADYSEIIVRGPNEILKVLVSETYYFTAIISAILVALSEMLILIFIATLLIYTNIYISLFIFGFLIFSTLLIKKIITPILANYGFLRDNAKKDFHENIAAIFKNYKYIKISPPNSKFYDKINSSINQYIDANTKASALSILPKNILEFLGYVTVILLFIYVLNDKFGSLEKTLPIITVFALGLTRMLPSVNKIINSINQVYYNKNSLNLIYQELNLLKESLPVDTQIEFEQLMFRNVSIKTRYQDKLLSDINFAITRGEKIGILGKSGSGKTTLVDSIIGLHPIESGTIFINKVEVKPESLRSIRSLVSYIPQQVYLFSGTVAENISMGLQYEESKIIDVLKLVDLWETFRLRNGIDTQVGESGVRLSGGQLQRIGVARALYKNSQIIIMDEPTASLDVLTATILLQELEKISKGKALIIISHQEKLLNICDSVYKIENNSLVEVN